MESHVRIDQQPAGSRATRWDALLLGLLGLSLVLNLILGVALLRLANRASPPEPAQEIGLALGSQAPPLEVQRDRGGSEVIRFDADTRPVVVYVISPSCQWCERNLPNIRALSSAAASQFRFVGIVLARAPSEYAAHARLGFEFHVASPRTLASYKLRGTPHTYVISPGGEVFKSWRSAYDGPLAHEIEEYFHVKLPGLGREGQ